MKYIVLIIFILSILISCHSEDNKNLNSKVANQKQESIENKSKIDSSLIWQTSQNTCDSIRLDSFRNEAFKLANNFRANQLIRIQSDTGKIVIFQEHYKFLYLRFNINSWSQKIEFYQFNNNKKTLIWEEKWHDMAFDFLGDTIRDVNGDNHLDLLTNFYPTSGCCRRNSFFIRLFNPLKKEYTEKTLLINPTFYPKEKIVRGIGYGHSGEVAIYKMKWNKLKLDTIEYIHPIPSKKDTFLVTEKYEIYPQRCNPMKGKIIYSLPEEYKNIESIEWFLNY